MTMDNPMEKALEALRRGTQDPELKEALEDPKSEVSRLLEAIRNRAAHAYDISDETLGVTGPEIHEVLSTLEGEEADDLSLEPDSPKPDSSKPDSSTPSVSRKRAAAVTMVLVRLNRVRRIGLLATASVTLGDEVVLHGIRVVVGREGPEVRFPKPSSDSSCLSCGAESGRDSNFCSECGRRLPARTRVARSAFYTFAGSHVLDYVRRQVLEAYRAKVERAATVRPVSFGDHESEQLLDVLEKDWDFGSVAKEISSPPQEPSSVPLSAGRGPGEGPAQPARRAAGAVLPAGDSSATEPEEPEPEVAEPTEDELATTHPLLAKYLPSERRAIVVHWFFLCADENRRVPGSEAVDRWERGPAKSWRQRKFWEDMHEQLNEIDRHKYHLSENAGRDVGWEFAAEDWIRKYSAAWRTWWEQHCDPQ